ncbi:SCO family protein [Caldimonas sp. KR1-144]|uniref:SCO family protein n=1 Tax=Caldimonas sp. KR1-144 TaxID=3400911 RepID=UPI003C0EB153
MPMILRRTLLAACAASMLVTLAGCDRLAALVDKKPAFQAVDITGADYGAALALTDADGRPRTMADFKGKVAVVFFGYTQCPDVCPTTMAEIAAAKKQLGAAGERVQGVFVSVDPARDTPEVLKAYVNAFDPSFVALRGTPEQTAAVAKSFKVFFQQVPGKEPGRYTIDHTAGAYVFDAEGRVRLFVRYGQPVEAWTADLRQLLG